MLSPLFASIVRTAVPAAVGALAAWLVTLGIAMPADVRAELAAFLTAFLTVAYFIVARAVERRYPALSWLLGSGQQPAAYVSSVKLPDDDTMPPEYEPYVSRAAVSRERMVTVDTRVLPEMGDDG